MVNVLSSKGMGPVVHVEIIPLLNRVTPKALIQCTFWSNAWALLCSIYLTNFDYS